MISMHMTQRFLDFAEETRLVEEGRRKEGKGRRSATDTGGGMRKIENLILVPEKNAGSSVRHRQ